jgi:hypothetical protein
MTRKSSQIESLNRFVQVLEDIMIDAPDDEILSLVADSRGATNDLKSLIETKIAEIGKPSKKSPLLGLRSPGKKSARKINPHSRNPVSRIALLRSLVMTIPELSPRATVMFSGKSTPTQEELDELAREMVLLGLLSEDDLKNE